METVWSGCRLSGAGWVRSLQGGSGQEFSNFYGCGLSLNFVGAGWD